MRRMSSREEAHWPDMKSASGLGRSCRGDFSGIVLRLPSREARVFKCEVCTYSSAVGLGFTKLATWFI